MKLEHVVLNNFRQYFGEQQLKLARQEPKQVTVIHGVNGAGKTSLFTAINWCLYAEGGKDPRELVSKEAIARAEPGQEIVTSVEVAFRHEGERFVALRVLKGVCRVGRSVDIYGDLKGEFILMRTGAGGQAERVPNPTNTMNAILPSNVRTYFLFDGEKIDNFAKPEAAAEVREAIHQVLRLEGLTRAQRHLEAAAQDYRRELRMSASGELRSLAARDEQARAEKAQAETRRGEVAKEIERARGKVAEISDQLRRLQDSQVLQATHDRLERDLKQRQGEREQTLREIQRLASASYLNIAEGVIGQALEILEVKRERGEIPGSIRKQFVEDLLGQLNCICGRPFEEGGPEYQRLQELVAKSLPGSIEDDVLSTTAALRTLTDRAQQQRVNLTGLMRQRGQQIEIIEQLQAELDEVIDQLKGSPLEEISRLAQQRTAFEGDIDKANMQLGVLGLTIEERAKEIADLEKEIAKARKGEEREKVLSRKMELAQQAADAAGEVYRAHADDMRLRIQEKAKEVFKQLVWKESHFQDVTLDADYKLEVIDRYGSPARPELSAGERQVLSLAFITAMSRVSEGEAPLVMDTPFGRLSSQPRENITRYLPDLADQLVLFVTDEELRDQARVNLEPRIGAEYRLIFDPRTSCTSIVEVLDGQGGVG